MSLDSVAETRSLGSGNSSTWNVAQPATRGRLSALLVKLGALEFFAVAVSAYLASLLYHFTVWQEGPLVVRYVAAASTIATLVLLVSIACRHFASVQIQPRHKFLWNGIGAVLLAFSLFLSLIFLLKIGGDYSRGAFVFQCVAVGAAVLSVRAVGFSKVHSAIASGEIEARRVVMIGGLHDTSQFISRLKSVGIRTIWSCEFPEQATGGVQDSSTAMSPHGDVRNVIARCRELHPDDIFIMAKHQDLPAVSWLTKCLSVLPAGVHIVLVDAPDLLATSEIAEFGNVTSIQVAHPPLKPLDRFLKRGFDLIVATLGLLILSPLLVIVSVAIKLDSPGPVFFLQRRHGYNNQAIRVLKFRTMTITEDGETFTQAVRNDPRVTNIGRILRRSSIDELPQLINVLWGDMSIVGPRPHATAHNRMFETLIPPLSRRHNVKPGITGWAQVNGSRGETDTLEKMQRRVELDLHYIDNWSFLLDCKIVVLTVFSRRAFMNAY